MSSREEHDLAGMVIDSLKFAAAEDCVTGKLALSRLPRLADVLLSTAGWLTCELSGLRDIGEDAGSSEQAGKPGLRVRVTGRLALCCQRCLAEVDFECVIDNRLRLMPPDSTEADWPEDELESDEYDAIPAHRALSVQALIEEEVLLALPIVPRHADCLPPGVAGITETGVEASEPSPFAVLAGLKVH
jgi:uncharacterized protein